MLVQLDDVVFFDIIDINVEPKQLFCIVLIGNLSKGLWRKQNLQCKLNAILLLHQLGLCPHQGRRKQIRTTWQ